MYYVYVIKHSETNDLYIGYSIDIEKRLQEHNNKESKFTSKKSGYWELVYFEAYKNMNDAITREKRLKHHGRAKQELYKRIEKSLSE
ncbi:MAG TPA: GIY-YIG nuclease family protein [Spirochaetota bacterium]|nr:GIY-YIG nuclease family protein [Spirochaetota bacterium]